MHLPVLTAEVVEWLAPSLADGGVAVDCTVGFGGHAESLLRAFPRVTLIGLDRDDDALGYTQGRLKPFGSRFRLEKANFSALEEVLMGLGHEGADALLYDLGVSSFQLDNPDRGFRLSGDGPLDMRMDRSSGVRAEDIVNEYSERDLARVIARYGEERFAGRIARAVVKRRARERFTKSADLAEVVKAAIPAATRRTGPHPARRTFQALRIEVNDEMRSLERSLASATGVLRPGGRIAVLSYHSLEDRIVKRTFAEGARGCTCPRDFPVCVCGKGASLRVLTSKPVLASAAEVAANPRADSAKLRVAEKLRELA